MYNTNQLIGLGLLEQNPVSAAQAMMDLGGHLGKPFSRENLRKAGIPRVTPKDKYVLVPQPTLKTELETYMFCLEMMGLSLFRIGWDLVNFNKNSSIGFQFPQNHPFSPNKTKWVAVDLVGEPLFGDPANGGRMSVFEGVGKNTSPSFATLFALAVNFKHLLKEGLDCPLSDMVLPFVTIGKSFLTLKFHLSSKKVSLDSLPGSFVGSRGYNVPVAVEVEQRVLRIPQHQRQRQPYTVFGGAEEAVVAA